MAKKTPNPADVDQVIDWLVASRTGHENAVWFINKIDPNGSITESNRGSFTEEGVWFPNKQERCTCCDEFKPNTEDPYVLISHCQTKEHVTNLVKGLSYRNFKKELHRMSKSIAASLEAIGF